MKKINLILLLLLLLTGCKINNKKTDLNIIVTSFPCYDVASSIVKENGSIKMLIKPGTEVHTYEPTPQDIIAIEKSDVFIYVGGESDEWVEDVLKSVENKDLIVIKLFDYVNVLEEDEEDNHKEHNDEYDEHIWTSPINLIKMENAVLNELVKLKPDMKDIFTSNANKYIEELKILDKDIREIVSTAKRNEIIFADRFPFKYFALEYGLTYKAAFLGCSSESEVSPKKLAELINTIKDDKIPVVFYLELSNQKIADTIVSETNSEKKLFHSGQNITLDEFKSGITLIDIMRNNLENLKGALN